MFSSLFFVVNLISCKKKSAVIKLAIYVKLIGKTPRGHKKKKEMKKKKQPLDGPLQKG